MSRRIAHLTSVHPAYDTRIFHKECRTLVSAGYEVVLVAPHNQDEITDGIRIHALPRCRSRWERMTRTLWHAYQAALEEGAQLYHFHDPELISVGLLLKMWGKQVIYDVHEGESRRVLTREWIPPLLRCPLATMFRLTQLFGASVFDGIIAAEPPIARRFPKRKTVLVQNFPIVHELANPTAQPYRKRDMIIAYVGGIGPTRGTREVVKAMSMLPHSLKARLVLAGRFRPPELLGELRQMPGWEQVRFVGWQSRDRVSDLLSKARIGVVTLLPVPNYVESYPTKLFEYMSAGIPVLGSDFPIWRQIVEGEECGLLVDPLDPEAIADALTWLLKHPEEAEAMGKRGQEAVRTRYNWDTEAQKLVQFYERLMT